jgi:hypothetical protein
MTSRNLALAAAAAVALGGAFLAWRALRPGPSDEQQIRDLIDATARAVEQKRPGDAVAGVSERFRGQGMDRRELRQYITYNALRGSWNAVVPVAVRIDVQGDRAEAVVDAALVQGARAEGIAAALPANADTWRIELELEREPEGFRVVTARWRPVGVAEGLLGTPPEGR